MSHLHLIVCSFANSRYKTIILYLYFHFVTYIFLVYNFNHSLKNKYKSHHYRKKTKLKKRKKQLVMISIGLKKNKFLSAEAIVRRCSKIFYKIHRKTSVLEPVFNKVVDPIKKRLQHLRFPMNFVKFLRVPFYRTPLGYCFC